MENLNVEKLVNSDFLDRLLGFVEKYSEVFNTNVVPACYGWIERQDFEAISYFLRSTVLDFRLPFSLHDFISMNTSTFMYFHERITQICTLWDERAALYEEFNSFYS